MPAAGAQPAAAVVASETHDRDFLAARDAFERRDLKALGKWRESFGQRSPRYLLADYLDYWWLLANLQQGGELVPAIAVDMARFLDRGGEGPLTDNLRREWLRALGKQNRWDLFLAAAPKTNIDDAEIDCHQWRYRLAQSDRAVLTEVRAMWNAARPLPEACYEAFDSARAIEPIPAASAWARVRRLLAENQLADARRSVALIDKLPVGFERATAQIGINPAGYLQKEKLNAKSPASVELFVFAFTRAARSDAGKAAALLEKYGAGLNPADRAAAWGQIGLHGAMQHDPAALAWFDAAGPAPLNDTQAGWKARAALRAGDWPALRAAIDAMTAAERREPAWRFWLARAELAQGNVAAATRLRESLARENNFYGLLAAEESGQLPAPSWQGWKPSSPALNATAARPGIARALQLYRLELKNEGLREWQFAIRNMSDEELLTAAELARRSGVPDRAINTAERTLLVHDFSQRFPTPHRADLQLQARTQGLDESWVYGLIRQESRFMADAKSRVGATGLMQLMPATARWAAKQTGLSTAALRNIGEVPVNLSLGAFYLRHVLDDLGHPVLATAAYNAGPGRARRWRAEQALEGAIYAETIPFNETRDYVKKVMANAWYYAHQSAAPGTVARSLKEMMGVVPGKTDGRGGSSSLLSIAAAPQR